LQQEAEAEKAKKNDEMKQFEAYQSIVRQVMLNGKAEEKLVQNESFLSLCYETISNSDIKVLFLKHLKFKIAKFEKEQQSRKALFESNSKLEFNKYQLQGARQKYGISEADANAIADILVDKGGFNAFSLSRD
jgi:hypothetical protein